MKPGQRLWTREELLLTLGLYIELPFGQLDARNARVKALAAQIGRTPDAVALRLVNFAAVDPALAQRGMSNAGKRVEAFWAECAADWNSASLEIAAVQAAYQHTTVENLLAQEAADALEPLDFSPLPAGTTVARTVQARVNQRFFRKAVLTAYDDTCCLTGLREPRLLVASHIRPWAEDVANRTNPCNGLALNALHDKAFDRGLFTFTDDGRVRVSPVLRHDKRRDVEAVRDLLLRYENTPLQSPRRTQFRPDPTFLAAHRARWEATW